MSNFFTEGLSSIGTGCPQRWWSHHPWRCSRNHWTWHSVLWSTWQGGDRSKDGLSDLRGLFQPWWLCVVLAQQKVLLLSSTVATHGGRERRKGLSYLPPPHLTTSWIPITPNDIPHPQQPSEHKLGAHCAAGALCAPLHFQGCTARAA